MEYTTRCALIGRKKGKEPEKYVCFVNLFDTDDPHLKPDTVPNVFLDFENIKKVDIDQKLSASYFLKGNDIVINKLVKISIEQDDRTLKITGEQES